MGYYSDEFNEWSEAMSSIVDDPEETPKDLAYYLTSGIVFELCNIANELHKLNEQLDRPLVVDNIGK